MACSAPNRDADVAIWIDGDTLMLRKALLTLPASAVLGAPVIAANAAFAFSPSPLRRRWHRISALLFDSYRPELHYMRGPGPKWREKHAGDLAT